MADIDFDSPQHVAASVRAVADKLPECAATLDLAARWLVQEAYRLEDRCSEARDELPLLPYTIAELVGSATAIREVVGRMQPFVAATEQTGAPSLARLRFKAAGGEHG